VCCGVVCSDVEMVRGGGRGAFKLMCCTNELVGDAGQLHASFSVPKRRKRERSITAQAVEAQIRKGMHLKNRGGQHLLWCTVVRLAVKLCGLREKQTNRGTTCCCLSPPSSPPPATPYALCMVYLECVGLCERSDAGSFVLVALGKRK
jgi:hypothetical protein